MEYVHPILGGLSILVLLYAASQGIRSRGRARHRARLLAGHATVAPWALAMIALTWLAGGLSTALLRDDLTLGETRHFALGTALLVTLIGSWASSRAALRGSENARELHVWLGVAAVLLAAGQAFTGLRITP